MNTNTGLLTVTDNLSAIKLDDLKFDTLNKNENPIFFKFETTIQKNISIILKENQNSNLIRIEGTITINGISRESIALWSPIQLITTSNTILIDFCRDVWTYVSMDYFKQRIKNNLSWPW